MGFFDRKSVTTNQQDILNRNVAAEIDGGGVSVVGSENVNVLDGGAISGIENTARNALAANAGLVDESLDFGRSALTSVQKIFETSTGRGPSVVTDDTLKLAIGAAIVVAGIYFFTKG